MNPPPSTLFLLISYNYDESTIEEILTPDQAAKERVRLKAALERAKEQHQRDMDAGRTIKGTSFRRWGGEVLDGPWVWDGENWARGEVG